MQLRSLLGQVQRTGRSGFRSGGSFSRLLLEGGLGTFGAHFGGSQVPGVSIAELGEQRR